MRKLAPGDRVATGVVTGQYAGDRNALSAACGQVQREMISTCDVVVVGVPEGKGDAAAEMILKALNVKESD